MLIICVFNQLAHTASFTNSAFGFKKYYVIGQGIYMSCRTSFSCENEELVRKKMLLNILFCADILIDVSSHFPPLLTLECSNISASNNRAL